MPVARAARMVQEIGGITSETVELLDLAKQKGGYVSDYALAKALGISLSRMSNYRTGRARLSEKIIVKVAEIAEEDVALTLAKFRMEATYDIDIREHWARVIHLIVLYGAKVPPLGAGKPIVLALAILSACLLPSPGPAPLASLVSAANPLNMELSNSVYYVKSRMAPTAPAGQPSTVILVTMGFLLFFTIRLRRSLPS